ncbi:MAG TPA: hypothetical protein VL132_10210 [Planctomycetaceae bacterium]|nr:hypothetical protein [Planctomycetaceae bacterium]
MRQPTSVNFWCGIAAVVAVAAIAMHGPLAAQTPKSKAAKAKGGSLAPAASPAVRAIDVKVEKLQDGFVRESTDIIKQYEDAGQYDRAKFLCEVLLKLDPKMPGLKEKLDKLTDLSLESNEFEFDLDVSRGWTNVGAMAVKDRLVRIEAKGDFKFSVTLETTPDGLPTDDAAADFVAGIAPGALMGVLVVDNKPGKPFAIRSRHEFTPDKNGVLLLKVNAPNGHKCSGKIQVKLSGFSRGS